MMLNYGDWGLGIGDWGMGDGGFGPKPKTQKHNPHNQKPKNQIIL